MSHRDGAVSRRTFIRLAGASGLSPALLLSGACGEPGLRAAGGDKNRGRRPQMIVLGIDGMDPGLCERLMNGGALPNLAKMRDAGGYRRLGTSIPPQSPVAWANFITGADAGVHGIFDFIHRDPARQCFPYYSAAETISGNEGWEVGDHRIPLTFWPFNHQPGETLLRRDGTPFWDYLDEIGVPVWLYDIPSNYPPSPSRYGNVRCLSGMGVPDLLGTYGTYQHFSEQVIVRKQEGGGTREPLVFKDNKATTRLVGPDNGLLKKPAPTAVSFSVHRHPTQPTARIELPGQTVVLKEGEWSDWCKVDFELQMPQFLPNEHVSGICRFYLQKVHPQFSLYASPLNIDPSDPGGQKISEPTGFVRQISDKLDLFYTTGFQEDHKALSNGVFSDEEYREQAAYVLQERLRLLEFAKQNYDEGLLFFYFSSTDLQAHMFWWEGEEKHPVRSAEEAIRYNGVLIDLYGRMDKVVGELTAEYGDQATIVVMSDHGFCNFRRQFNLNAWLRGNGYLYPPDCRSLMNARRRPLVDWSLTKAYGLGLNGLYLNLAGRERDGVVSSLDRDRLLEEITQKLLGARDPVDGKPAIAEVHRAERVYSGPNLPKAPDLIIGYHRGYRASWDTALGDMGEQVFSDNDSAWSADHCMATGQLPGVVFSNRAILRDGPSLIDMAPTILETFGVKPPETMSGGSLFAPREVAGA